MAKLIYDEFKVLSVCALNNDDLDALTSMYLPITGIDSYSLYITLSSLKENEKYNYKKLLDLLSFKTLANINEASSKLEALGLIDLYKNKDDNYAYVINRPLSVNEFLSNGFLRDLLITRCGEDYVIGLSDVTPNLKSYKKITKKFNEVFDIGLGGDFDILKKYITNDIEITNNKFNYTLFKMLFDSNFIGEDVLNDLGFERKINEISFLYKLDEYQMKDVVIASLDIQGNLDYSSLSIEAKKAFNKANMNHEPRLVTLEKDDYLASIKDDDMLRLCNALEALSPTELLERKSGMKPSTADIKIIEDLINNTKFPVSLINFMVMMVLEEKDGEFPSYEYFNKIANTWARAKIKNVPDAIRYLDKKNSEAKTSKGKDGIKVMKKPAWYEEYNKELSKKLEDNEELSKDEIADILNDTKDLFGE